MLWASGVNVKDKDVILNNYTIQRTDYIKIISWHKYASIPVYVSNDLDINIFIYRFKHIADFDSETRKSTSYHMRRQIVISRSLSPTINKSSIDNVIISIIYVLFCNHVMFQAMMSRAV